MVDHLFSSANGHGGFQRAGHNQGACAKAKKQKRLQAASKRLQKGAGEAKRNATRPAQSSVRYPWLGEDQQPVANLWIWPTRLTTATRWRWFRFTCCTALERGSLIHRCWLLLLLPPTHWHCCWLPHCRMHSAADLASNWQISEGSHRAGHNQGACTMQRKKERLQAAGKRWQQGGGRGQTQRHTPHQELRSLSMA